MQRQIKNINELLLQSKEREELYKFNNSPVYPTEYTLQKDLQTLKDYFINETNVYLLESYHINLSK